MRPSAVRTLQTWRLEQCSGEEVRGAVRPAELPKLGGAAPAGGTSQARRSSTGGWTFRRGGAKPAGGPSGRSGVWEREMSGRLLSFPRAASIVPGFPRSTPCARASAAAEKSPAQLGRPPTRRLQRLRPAESAPSHRRAPPRRYARLGPQLAP